MIQQVGPYRIEREIGRGGMGVVYLARDERLDRDVAIKALPARFVEDPARLERFEREAITLASLNHPNIAGIYGIEEQDYQKYLILEYVEGETLGERLDRGTLPIEEALETAIEIASGVEAAHESGVIHRDLKPDNIKITPDGKVKILDFGLARTEETGSSSIEYTTNSPTLTSPARHSPTMPGVILGTAAYMSPEQARGRKIDKRTDIWSFGVILYEMLTGASPFVGETVTDSIGAVLHKDINLNILPPETPRAVYRVIRRCIERNRDLRYRHIGDAQVELRHPIEDTIASSTIQHQDRTRTWGLIVVFAALAVTGWLIVLLRGPNQPPTVQKFDVVSAADDTPAPAQGKISPDGKYLAYIADDSIHIRELSSFITRTIPNTSSASRVFWSHNSEWIGYCAEMALYKVARRGGAPVKLTEAASAVGGGAWLQDETIVYSLSRELKIIPARGGRPIMWMQGIEREVIDYHDLSVARRAGVVFVSEHRTTGSHAILATNGERWAVVAEMENEVLAKPAWSPTGHVLYTRGRDRLSVWAVEFDVKRLQPIGDPFLVLQDAGDASLSDDGLLLLRRRGARPLAQFVWVTPGGSAEPAGIEFESHIVPVYLKISPDGTNFALSPGDINKRDVWVHDLERRSKRRITHLDADVTPIAWSPDGREIAIEKDIWYDDTESVTIFMASDGSGRETRPGIDARICSIDSDWKRAVVSMKGDDGLDFLSVSLDEPSESTHALTLRNVVYLPAISPDGSLLAYTTEESGVHEVFCTGFLESSERWQISTEGGSWPQWSADGNTLYYQAADGKSIMAVSVTREPTIDFGIPQAIVDAEALDLNLSAGWCPDPTGDRFLAVTSRGGRNATISAVLNWFEEFKNQGK